MGRHELWGAPPLRQRQGPIDRTWQGTGPQHRNLSLSQAAQCCQHQIFTTIFRFGFAAHRHRTAQRDPLDERRNAEQMAGSALNLYTAFGQNGSLLRRYRWRPRGAALSQEQLPRPPMSSIPSAIKTATSSPQTETDIRRQVVSRSRQELLAMMAENNVHEGREHRSCASAWQATASAASRHGRAHRPPAR